MDRNNFTYRKYDNISIHLNICSELLGWWFDSLFNMLLFNMVEAYIDKCSEFVVKN